MEPYRIKPKESQEDFYINQALTGHDWFPTYQGRFFKKKVQCVNAGTAGEIVII